MDGQRFDSLTRAFASRTDRRKLFKRVGGATLAGAAGISVTHTSAVRAEGGTVGPGGECTVDDDCAQGSCSASAENQPGICYCLDPDRPVIGCACSETDPEACEGRPDICCGGSCISPMATCTANCPPPGTQCREDGCCYVGACSDDGWCIGCIGGSEYNCAALSEALGADFECCTYGNPPGSEGTCVPDGTCVVQPPNTGSGIAARRPSWIAPAAAVGAAAVVAAVKGRSPSAEHKA